MLELLLLLLNICHYKNVYLIVQVSDTPVPDAIHKFAPTLIGINNLIFEIIFISKNINDSFMN